VQQIVALLHLLSHWLADRAVQLGLIEDELLNVILFNGKANMTVSRRSALAQQREEGEGRSGWGCFMCNYILRVAANRTHCADTLAGKSVPAKIAIKAWAFITLALAIIIGTPIWLVF